MTLTETLLFFLVGFEVFKLVKSMVLGRNSFLASWADFRSTLYMKKRWLLKKLKFIK